MHNSRNKITDFNIDLATPAEIEKKEKEWEEDKRIIYKKEHLAYNEREEILIDLNDVYHQVLLILIQ